MKNKLLLTTALVATSCAVNAYAENLVVSGTQTIKDGGMQWYDTIKVEKGATLNLISSSLPEYNDDDTALEDPTVTNIITSSKKTPNMDIIINGTLNMVNSILEAGNDDDGLASNSNILLDGATVSMTDSDLEASGDITINNTEIKIITQNLKWYTGVWAENNIIISDSKINVEGSYLEASKDITISGNNTDINAIDTDIISYEGNINISGGNINMEASAPKFGDIIAEKDLNINGGNVVLKNSGIFSENGTINVSGGKLNLSQNEDQREINMHAVDINVSGGELNFSNSRVSAYNKFEISGGTFNLDDTELLGGDFIIKNGNLNFNNGSYINANDLTISGGNLVFDTQDKSNESYITSDNLKITGGNILVKNNSDIYGMNFDFSGGTITLEEGALKSENLNINGGTVIVQNGNSIIHSASTTVGKGGVIDLGNNTLTLQKIDEQSSIDAGNIVFADGSTLKTTISSADTYGKLVADNITIEDNTTLNVTLDNGVVKRDETKEFSILEGNVEGNFTDKIANNSRYDIVWSEDKAGTLEITGVASASDVALDAGGTENNANTAEAWDVLLSSTASENAKAVASILNELSQHDEAAYVNALTAIAPDVAPMVQQTQSETTNQVFAAVGSRLSGGTSSAGQGLSSGDNPFKKIAVWVQGLYNKSKLNNTSSSKGFDAKTAGAALGLEGYINKTAKVGVGYAYNHTDIDGFMRDTDVDTHTAILYGEYKPSAWYMNGVVTYGWSDYTEKKNVSGLGVKANYDVETFGIQAMTGYELNLNSIGITPEAGLRYVYIKQDSYKDTADQRVSGNSNNVLTAVVGSKVSKAIKLDNGIVLKPEARLAATYDLKHDNVSSVVSLANGSAYTVRGKALNRFGVEVGAGVSAEINKKVELSLGYEGRFRDHYQDHTGLLNAKYNF